MCFNTIIGKVWGYGRYRLKYDVHVLVPFQLRGIVFIGKVSLLHLSEDQDLSA